MRLILPTRIEVSSRKCFILNLNNYRNAHYHTLNTAKRNYKHAVKKALPSQLDKIEYPVLITYTLIKGDKRKCDVSNICPIVEKFTCDALQELGVLSEDDYNHVCESRYAWGGIDKGKERVEMHIQTKEATK